MIQPTNFIRLCIDLNNLNNQYERAEIKHYDYMIKYDATLKNWGYTKPMFLDELGKVIKKNFYAKKPEKKSAKKAKPK